MGAPTRASLRSGVGRIERDGWSSLPETDYSLILKEVLSDVKVAGQTIDKRVLEYMVELTFPGDGRLGDDAIELYWNQFAGMYTGQTLFAADVPTTVNCADGELHTIVASNVTKPPSMILHPDKGAVGSTLISGIVADELDFEDEHSLHDIADSGASYPDTAFVPSQILRQQYFGAWGAVGGFTDFQMQDGWTIDFNLTLKPVPVQGVTRDFKFVSLEIMLRGIPVGPTAAQIKAAMLTSGSGATVGRSLHASAAQLVISGADGVPYVTVPKAALYKGGYTFSGEKLRNDEVYFYGCRDATAGVFGDLYTIANAAPTPP